MEKWAASLRDCLWEQHSKQVKALILLIISILFVVLLSLTGCVSSSSNEDTSSKSSSSESKTEKYTNHEAGFTVSLPRYWTEQVGEDSSIEENSYRMVFSCDFDFIYCTPRPGFEDASISDYSEEDIAELSLMSVEDVSKKKLASGSYYLVKESYDDDSVERHAISYVTFKNDYLIDFMYVSIDDKNSKLSDFEDMVDSASFSKSDSKKSSGSKSSKSSSKSKKPDDAIDWSEASNHVGETVTVYGKVKDTDYATSSDGKPIFIDIGASYPDSSRVTAVIWEEDRSAFSSSPESYYEGKTVCVTGEIYLYEGVCDIKVTSPSQIEVLD